MSKNKIFILIATIMFCFAGFNNKYPLLTENSDTYIDAGFTHQMPFGGSLVYGLFVTHASWATSLWFLILVQSLLVAIVLYLVFKYLSESSSRLYGYLSYAFSCAVLMSGSLMASTVDPGIFSALLVLCSLLLLWAKKISVKDKRIVLFILLLSLISSSFNLLLGIILAVLCLVFIPFYRKLNFSMIGLGLIIGLIAISLLSISSINKFKTGEFKPFANHEETYLPRLTKAGFLHNYLLVEQVEVSSEVNKNRDSLEVLFTDNSMFREPFLTTDQVHEYRYLSKQILDGKHFISEFAGNILTDFSKELISVDPGKQLELNDSTIIKSMFKWYNEDVREAYTTRQLSHNLKLNYLGYTQLLIVFLCILYFVYKVYKRELKDQRGTWIFMLSVYIIHALLTSFMHGYCHNQWHIAWLVPLPLFLYLTPININKKRSCLFELQKGEEKGEIGHE